MVWKPYFFNCKIILYGKRLKKIKFMKLLVIGSSAKENAIISKLIHSQRVDKIFCIGNNPQIEQIATLVKLAVDDFPGILNFILEEDINLTIVCSKQPRINGLVEYLQANKIIVFGGNTTITKLEKSYKESKNFFNKYEIKTPHSEIFENAISAIAYLQTRKYPLFVKYEGTSEGRGVYLCYNKDEAKKRIEKGFQANNQAVIIEDYIKGKEIILNVFSDGYNAIPLPACSIYKRVLEGDGGAFTSGMGGFAPLDYVDGKIEEKIAHKVVFPIIDIFANEKISHVGILQFQIILDGRGELYLLGIKGDFGKTDAQTILPLIECDLFDLFYATATGSLEDYETGVALNEMYSVSVVVKSNVIPSKSNKNQIIEGIELLDNDNIFVYLDDVEINEYGDILTKGENVLTVVSIGSTLRSSYDNLYTELNNLKFKGIYYRKDIARNHLDINNLLQNVKM